MRVIDVSLGEGTNDETTTSAGSKKGVGVTQKGRRGRTRRVQKHKRAAKPLMVALFLIMIDELGDSPACGS